MQQDSFLLYGANGYTGRLVARYAAQNGLRPVLSGRRAEALAPLASELGLTYRVVDLNDAEGLDALLSEHDVVLHAAGPFQYTAPQMVEACLRTGTHYLDINGDIEVFEMLKGYDAAGKERGVMIMPGVGFDVVPTDCLSLFLKKQLPDATHLKLAFTALG
ncbi:MAG TPA: saccharopine dehydrogenase NADP-binding domain-containing protein, partial [Chitinophagaceae bacterium]